MQQHVNLDIKYSLLYLIGTFARKSLGLHMCIIVHTYVYIYYDT